MKIPAKVDYACKALLELSLHWPNPVPLQINEIAGRQNIPIKFLTHILISLKQLGLVKSVRGKKGGYILRKSPKEVMLSEVVLHFAEGLVGGGRVKQKKAADVIEGVWHGLEEVAWNFLNGITFEDLADRSRNFEKVLMFTI